MRSLRYLNGILTIIAILLTLNLYGAWNTTPGGQMLGGVQEAQAQGIANAGAQRQVMVDLLKKISVQLVDLQKTMTDGSMRARIEAAPAK